MTSLRSRFQGTTGLLVGLQLGATVLAIATWTGVLRYTAREQEVAGFRTEVDRLGEALRERYVHETHTFIEGGPSHLDHLDGIEAVVDQRLAAVASLPQPAQAELARVRTDLERDRAFFRDAVVPLARAGTLDRATATALHDQAELLAADVAADVGRVAAALDRIREGERAAVARATRWAWAATASLLLGAVGLAVALGWRLGNAVLRPLQALLDATTAFGQDREVAAPEDGDDEVAELGRAFNRATSHVRAAQRERVRTERLVALGEMSAAVAHELRNPLAVILGHPAVREDPALAPVREEAEHAAAVVSGLLGFARPSEEAPGPVDLRRQVTDAVARAEAHAPDGVSLRATIEADATVVAAPGAVRQVLDNLVRNAVEASADGEVEVVLAAGPIVEVRDRGAGLPPAVRARLYEPFATGRPTGTGLGLAVCQRIVRGAGGTLEHADRDGGGTVARWRLGA